MNFTEFKTEFLLRAKSADACSDEYKRAYKSESFSELLKVITDNFSYCCKNKIIDADLLNSIPTDDLKAADIHVNTSASSGWIYAYDSATVMASGSATVRAYGSATVEASGSAYINSFNSRDHKISGNAILRYFCENRVVLAQGIKSFNQSKS